MTKRASGKFKRRAQDAYDTPAAAVEPLRTHLPEWARYWEPCAGAGHIVNVLPGCCASTDSHPREWFVDERDALTLTAADMTKKAATHIVTNPPWTRQILHPMIEHFAALRPTWLLFDADWMHTRQAVPFMAYCQRIVSVGRVSWMQNGTSGLDNCAWYLFDRSAPGTTQFFARTIKGYTTC